MPDDIGSKAKYVRTQSSKAHSGHHCHWPGCSTEVHPALWGCKKHWFALPEPIRREIWRTYRAGQEVDKNPTPEYIRAFDAAIEWIKKRAHA